MDDDKITKQVLMKYYAWLLEQFHHNPTSEILHSTDIAIGWLKAYAEYRDINICFGVDEKDLSGLLEEE